MKWNLDFMAKSDEGKAYMDVAKRVDEAIQVRARPPLQERVTLGEQRAAGLWGVSGSRALGRAVQGPASKAPRRRAAARAPPAGEPPRQRWHCKRLRA